jgi:hypothetical protein
VRALVGAGTLTTALAARDAVAACLADADLRPVSARRTGDAFRAREDLDFLLVTPH